MPDWVAYGPAPWWLAILVGVFWLGRREYRAARRVADAGARLERQRWERARDERVAVDRLRGERNIIALPARRSRR